MTDTPRDWRGIPITPGALVIYGAPIGRSIELVEAYVDPDEPFTKSGRVWLRVVRRAATATYRNTERVHVGADRLTVVPDLAPSAAPTVTEAAQMWDDWLKDGRVGGAWATFSVYRAAWIERRQAA